MIAAFVALVVFVGVGVCGGNTWTSWGFGLVVGAGILVGSQPGRRRR